MSASAGVVGAAARGPIPRAVGPHRAEVIAFGAILLVLNLPLLFGGSAAALSFQGEAVARGEWWRLLTHPFVHVSWYHLLLDGAAFLSLYANLHAECRWQRLAIVAASAAGSLIVALCASPLIATHGLCGLSGVAHGLMAVSALEMLCLPRIDRGPRAIAWMALAVVIAKCAIEATTGQAFFANLHFGLLGTPIVACHAGGVLGGLLMAWAFRPAHSDLLLNERRDC